MECKIDLWNDVETGTCNPYFKFFPLFSNKKWMSTKESAKIFQHRLTKKLFIEDFFSTRFNIVNEQRGLPLRIFYFKFRFRWLKFFFFFARFCVQLYCSAFIPWRFNQRDIHHWKRDLHWNYLSANVNVFCLLPIVIADSHEARNENTRKL